MQRERRIISSFVAIAKYYCRSPFLLKKKVMFYGDEILYESCPFCGGTGRVIDRWGDEVDCRHCDGSGTIAENDPEYLEFLEEQFTSDEYIPEEYEED